MTEDQPKKIFAHNNNPIIRFQFNTKTTAFFLRLFLNFLPIYHCIILGAIGRIPTHSNYTHAHTHKRILKHPITIHVFHIFQRPPFFLFAVIIHIFSIHNFSFFTRQTQCYKNSTTTTHGNFYNKNQSIEDGQRCNFNPYIQCMFTIEANSFSKSDPNHNFSYILK